MAEKPVEFRDLTSLDEDARVAEILRGVRSGQYPEMMFVVASVEAAERYIRKLGIEVVVIGMYGLGRYVGVAIAPATKQTPTRGPVH